MSAYRDLAEIYDDIYAWKDYEAEALRLKNLLGSAEHPAGRGDPRRGVRDGTHLSYLAKWFRVTGVDASREMLARARRKLPRVPLYRARMQSFHLGQRFDAVLCLFSAIGYVRSPRELKATLENLVRHLARRRVLVIDPWVEPTEFLPRHVHLLTVDRPGYKIARLTASRRRADRSILEMHYLVARPGSVQHIRERHTMLLVPKARMQSWLEALGLSVRVYPKGLTGRGLIVARMPGAAVRGPGRKRSGRVTTPGSSLANPADAEWLTSGPLLRALLPIRTTSPLSVRTHVLRRATRTTRPRTPP